MISVIIPTYNERPHIRSTIERLWQIDEANHIKEIIVADGASTDHTLQVERAEGITAGKVSERQVSANE